MKKEDLEDSAMVSVKKLRDSGDLVASFFLCSAFIEHYCKTKLLISLMEKRPTELREVIDKRTKKPRKAHVYSDLKEIIWKTNLSQSRIIDIGFLVGAWDFKLRNQLKKYNKKRNNLVHKHEDLLEVLEKDEKDEVRKIVELGLSLLLNIKYGYIKF